MFNQKFKTPLTQTVGIIALVILLIASMGFSGGASGGAGSIAQLILFVVGLAISLVFAIAVMIGIFFAAIAMYDKSAAAKLWGDFKTCSSSLSCSCSR